MSLTSVLTSNSAIIPDDQIKSVKRTVFNSHVQTNIIPNYHSISDVIFPPSDLLTKSENETDSENSESGEGNIVGFRHGYGHHWPYRHYGYHGLYGPYGHYGHYGHYWPYWHRYRMYPYGAYPYSSLF